jgi:hypothetical protein
MPYCSVCKIDKLALTAGEVLVEWVELEASAATEHCKACILMFAALQSLELGSSSEIAVVKLYNSASGTRILLEFGDGMLSPKFELFTPESRYQGTFSSSPVNSTIQHICLLIFLTMKLTN